MYTSHESCAVNRVRRLCRSNPDDGGRRGLWRLAFVAVAAHGRGSDVALDWTQCNSSAHIWGLEFSSQHSLTCGSDVFSFGQRWAISISCAMPHCPPVHGN